MNIDDAKGKVCPFIQQRGFVQAGLNHTNQLHQERLANDSRSANIKCICGDCMAWVWNEDFSQRDENGRLKKSNQEGYCSRLYPC